MEEKNISFSNGLKGIIIYQTTMGATKEYAQWLNEALDWKMYSLKENYENDLKEADIVIIGSPVFAMRPKNLKWIIKNWNILKDKNPILYTTSGAKPDDPTLLNGMKNNIPTKIYNNLKYFPLGGRLLHKNMSWIGKLMMSIGKKIIKDPVIKKRMGKEVDNVDKNSIQPILDYINSLN